MLKGGFMAIAVNICYYGENGNAVRFAEEMIKSGTVEKIRKEKGKLRYEYFFPMEDKEAVLLIDVWENQESIDKHHSSPMMKTIIKLREKYDLRMRVERFISDENGLPEADKAFIRTKEKVTMDKNDCVSLFLSLHPDFFNSGSVKDLDDDSVFEDMLLKLEDFDTKIYEKNFDNSVSFGLYKGDTETLRACVEKVEESWAEFFGEDEKIYCAFVDEKVASFCIIEDNGIHEIDGKNARIGGVGCVGTLPEYRNKGLGLTMVKKATELLKKEGFDYSQIHYTAVADWYARLGFRTFLKWNRNGAVD